MEAGMNIGDRVEASPCMVCGETERQIVANLGRGFTPLTTAICPGCGLVSHHPLPSPEDIQAFYASKYRVAYKGAWEPKPKHTLRAIRGAVSRAQRLAAHLPAHARVLDVGASSGEFTYAMSRSGFRAVGVEPNQGYAAFAQKTYGVDVLNGPLETAGFGSDAFELIHLNHVFEHLSDPLGALAIFSRWLAPGGLLFLEVPNLLGVRKQAMNTFHYAHIWNFTPQTLLAVTDKGGFNPVAGEDLNSTSIVFRKTSPPRPDLRLPQPGLRDRLVRQIHTEQNTLEYFLSGAPLTRRWNRLRRNIDEFETVRTFKTVREMANAVIEAGKIRAGGAHTPLVAQRMKAR
jgi:SAM-dependent methyltransferase